MRIVFIFIVAFLAALSSSMSGAGAGIIVFPSLLWMGFSYPLVAAISSVNSACWVLPAARNYLKGRSINRVLVAGYSLIGLIGCYLGVLLVVHLNQRILELCVGGLIVFLVVYAYIRKGFGEESRAPRSIVERTAGYIASLFLGFYETVFGSGNGILFSMLTIRTEGFEFSEALGHYYLVSFSWALYAAILLARKGYYDVPVMVTAAVGSILGGWLGSLYARGKGNRFLKLLALIIGGLLGIKMMMGW